MSINVAFKLPDAVVFATDGLSSLVETDPIGAERIVASVPYAEKLVLLSNDAPHAALLGMFNGAGSLGTGGIATELRQYDRLHPRGPAESVVEYCERLNAHLLALENALLTRQGHSARPFHLIVAGFDGSDGNSAAPKIFEIKWAVAAELPDTPRPVLHDSDGDGHVEHRYGTYYAGATTAIRRFDEGYDPDLCREAAYLLAGAGRATAAPGILEELVQEARRSGPQPAAAPLPNDTVKELVERYTRRILHAVFRPQPAPISEHFSLQAAVNYCAFLAHCAYAYENFSPVRNGPPRVGAPLQVGCLTRDGRARSLSGIQLGVAYGEFGGGLS